MRVAVFTDAHAHADALEAVIAAAGAHGVDELWSLGDMVGRGPEPARVVARTRECCRVALLGNHDYDALRSTEPVRFARSFALAREQLDEDAVAWMRSRRPAATRAGVQCWHASPRNPVHEYVGAANAAACLEKQRAPLGLVGHTHVPAAWHSHTRRVRLRPGEPLDISAGEVAAEPGRGRCAGVVAVGLVGRARRPGGGALAAARSRRADRDLAVRAVRSRTHPCARPRARPRRRLGFRA